MFIVGLTGGIGSGKTSAAKVFSDLGVVVVDADEISREVTSSGGRAINAIKEAFGEKALNQDGSMNRPYMRNLVFKDSAARERLENIIHPLVEEESFEKIKTAKSPYIILSVPLLTEKSFWLDKINRLLVIDLQETEQIQRVMHRDGLSAEEVKRIIGTQSSRQTRISMASDVIVNCQDEDALKASILRLHRLYLSMV